MLQRLARLMLICLLGLLVLTVFLAGGYAVQDFSRDEASAQIDAADGSLRRAFGAVSEAEGAGVNVSSLLLRLNEAGSLFSSAEVAFQNGNYSLVVEKASVCAGVADGVFGDAGVLKGEALEAAAGWWRLVVFSVVGACVFVGVLAVVWVFVRRRYAGRVLGLKPEVTG